MSVGAYLVIAFFALVLGLGIYAVRTTKSGAKAKEKVDQLEKEIKGREAYEKGMARGTLRGREFLDSLRRRRERVRAILSRVERKGGK